MAVQGISGRWVVGGIAGIAVAMGALLWWTQTRAYYVEVTGIERLAVGSQMLDVAGYTGIDADSSPIKLRGCFTVDPGAIPAALEAGAALTAEAEAAGYRITPLVAPDWFGCFDAGAVTEALETGEAQAIVAARNEIDGVDRIVVLWPDGRGVTWRQLNEKFAE